MLRAMKVYEGNCGGDPQQQQQQQKKMKMKKKNSSCKENRTPISMAMAAAANDTTNPIAKSNHNTNTSNHCTNPNAKPCFPYPAPNPNPNSSSPKSSSKENESPNTNTNAISNTNPTTTTTTNACNDLKFSADNDHTNANANANAHTHTHTHSNANLSRGGGFFGYGKQSNILKKAAAAAAAHTRQSSTQDWFHTCELQSGPASRPLLSRSNSSMSVSRRRKKNPGESCGDSRFLESPTTPTHNSHVWDDPDSYGDSHTAPASAWSTLATRALLCRPLPLDVGRCVCYITRERLDGVNCFALYTDEGYGRQDRKLAVALHKRRAGKSEFVVFSLGLESNGKSGGAILGRVQANLLGTRFLIWDEAEPTTSQRSSLPPLLGVVMFQPTATTLTGSFRVMRVSIPKYQSTQIVPSTYRENGLAQDWEENTRNSYQLYSRKPIYNKATRSYELDFKDRTKKSTKIMTSARNLQLTMNENGKQTILMLGKIGKSKFLMEYRFPMTAYQAFSISLASMDSKLCCSL